MILITTTNVQQQATIKQLQQQLLELGYPNVGIIDGDFGLESQGAVLDFMNRNHMIEPPVIDDKLLAALKSAPKKTQPERVVLATTPEISPKVAAVSQTGWTRFVAKVAAIPAGIATVFLGIVQNLGDAIEKLSPLKAFLQEWIGSIQPLTMILTATSVVSILSFIIWFQTARVQNALTDGYQKGTVKDDNTLDTTPTVITETGEEAHG